MSTNLLNIISKILILLVAFPVHEFSHAWVADYFGDDTPRMQGRVTLNPLKHLDLFGAILMMTAGFGWAKPVMVNPYRLSMGSKWGPLYVSIAGPVSNLLLALLIGVPLRILAPFLPLGTALVSDLYTILYFFVFFNFILMLFNMLPVIPLDGEKVLYELLPLNGQNVLLKMRAYSFGPMLVLFFLLPRLGIDILGIFVARPAGFLTNLLLP